MRANSRSAYPTAALGLVATLALMAPDSTVAASGPPVLACSAERATIGPGESVRLRAWAAGNPDAVSRYAWDARIGRVVGTGPRVRWDLSALQTGQYAVAVRATYRNGAVSEECVVRVVIRRDAVARGTWPPAPRIAAPGVTAPAAPPPPPTPAAPAAPAVTAPSPDPRIPTAGRETGGAFLVAEQREAPGYGLYSYLLFGAPPTKGTRERHLKALEAYVGLIPDILSLEQYIPPAQLNIAYVPLQTVPPQGAGPDQLLERYDYARARSLLRFFPGGGRDGPYIVSTLRPLGDGAALPNPYLFQDLSTVPPHLVAAWVKEFLNQAAQERFWEERSAERFALRLRVTIGVLGAALPDVKKALDTWIAWVR